MKRRREAKRRTQHDSHFAISMDGAYGRPDKMPRILRDLSNLQANVKTLDKAFKRLSQSPARSFPEKHGICDNHPRLGRLTWERSDVQCPVCTRKGALEQVLVEGSKLLGTPVPRLNWDGYFVVWDLPEKERKKRTDELAMAFRKGKNLTILSKGSGQA